MSGGLVGLCMKVTHCSLHGLFHSSTAGYSLRKRLSKLVTGCRLYSDPMPLNILHMPEVVSFDNLFGNLVS